MMWRTHALLGVDALWLLAVVPGVITSANISPLCALAAFGALLPDLDASESKIKSLHLAGIRPFAPLAWLAHRRWGHRGLLHAPQGLALAGLVCLALGLAWGWLPSLALWLGYASHLAGDACTKSGIPRSSRHTEQRFHLLPPYLRITTGSWAEEALLPLLALPVLFLLFSRFPTS